MSNMSKPKKIIGDLFSQTGKENMFKESSVHVRGLNISSMQLSLHALYSFNGLPFCPHRAFEELTGFKVQRET